MFETTASTLAGAGKDTMLGASWNASCTTVEGVGVAEYFIDRNPAYFAMLLYLLRMGRLHEPPHIPKGVLYRTSPRGCSIARRSTTTSLAASEPRAGASSTATSSTWSCPHQGENQGTGPLSVRRTTKGVASCTVNWMLEERRLVYLYHALVNDKAYLDASTLLVAARERPLRCSDGVAAFSTLTSDLHHCFRVAHDRLAKNGGERGEVVADGGKREKRGLRRVEKEEYEDKLRIFGFNGDPN